MLAYLVDAFTEERFKGNRAGVVFDADGLSRGEKQQIAAEIAAPETAFVSQSERADYKVEFFTPTTEVNFCGHATIATFYMLAALERVQLATGVVRITQETKAGVLPVAIERRAGRIFVSMKQRRPQFAEVRVAPWVVADALGIAVDELHAGYAVGVSNTGNWHLMVPVVSKSVLDSISYAPDKLSAILTAHDAITAHVFYPGADGLYFARNFCPTIGIPEDPATGAAAGAFGAYLARTGKLVEGVNELRIVQGEAMGRVSHLAVAVQIADGDVEDVEVSGTAVPSFVLSTEFCPARKNDAPPVMAHCN